MATRGKKLASHADSLGVCQEPEDTVLISLFLSASALSRQVCSISAEQQRKALHPRSIGRLLSHSGPTSPILLLLTPSLRIKRLFVLPQRCLSLVSPPLPSSLLPILLSGNERIFFGDRSCLSCADPEGLWLSLSL